MHDLNQTWMTPSGGFRTHETEDRPILVQQLSLMIKPLEALRALRASLFRHRGDLRVSGRLGRYRRLVAVLEALLV